MPPKLTASAFIGTAVAIIGTAAFGDLPQFTDDQIMSVVYILLAVLTWCIVTAVIKINHVRKDIEQIGKMLQAAKNPVRLDDTAKDN